MFKIFNNSQPRVTTQLIVIFVSLFFIITSIITTLFYSEGRITQDYLNLRNYSQEIGKLADLRFIVSESTMPANDYLLTKKNIYKENFKELDSKMIALLNSINIALLNKKELKEFKKLKNNYIQIKKISLEIFSHKLQNVTDYKELNFLMEVMDYKYAEKTFKNVSVIIDSYKKKIFFYNQRIYQKKEATKWVMGIYGLIFILILLIASGIVKKTFIEPMHYMMNKTKEISYNNLEFKIDRQLPFEFNEIALTFKNIVDNLKEEKVASDTAHQNLQTQYLRVESLYKALQIERGAKEELSTIFDSLFEGVIGIDKKENIIIIWNKGAERLTGWTNEEVSGKSCFEYLKCRSEDGKEFCGEGCHIFLRGILIKDFNSNAISTIRQIHTKDGNKIIVKMNTTNLKDNENNVIGYVTTFYDITREKEIEKMKNDFVSTVSHEFRTPLTALLGFSELILTKDYPLEKIKYFVNIISSESKRLLSMVNDLLDIRKIEAGKLELKKSKFNLCELLKEKIMLLSATTKIHNIIFANNIDDCEVLADKEKIEHIIINLLSNAIKYSPAGGKITMGFKKTTLDSQHYFELSVKDEGMGIPKQDLEKIFDKFSRVEKHSEMQIRGTGLGLALVKEFVDLHQGKIWVESEENKGSTFFVLIPVENSLQQ